MPAGSDASPQRMLKSSAIILRVDDVRSRLDNLTTSSSPLHYDDAYVITTTPGDVTNGNVMTSSSGGGVVDVAGQSSAGVFYAVQTLLSLLTEDVCMVACCNPCQV